MFQELVENLPMVTYVDEAGARGRTLYVSPQVEDMLGYPAQAWLDDPDFLFEVVHPEDRTRVYAERRDRAEERDSSLVFRVVARSGRVSTVQSERVIVRDEQGAPIHTLGFWVDITERVRLADELREAQKLEALGRLAGGIAHDFNNLHLALRGYGEFALQHLANGEESLARHDISEMLSAAERVGNLTRELLAFARKQVLAPELLDLNVVVSELEGMLRCLLGAEIELMLSTAASPVRVYSDRGRLEQAIANIAVNARDAMPAGGRFAIAVGATNGSSATLALSDSGSGIDPATASRIFEPFFTTKGSQGTGLGLATVHGLVTQSGGRISVQSAPGAGTTFTIELPAIH
jgi:PAS domain S-box-containing protein